MSCYSAKSKFVPAKARRLDTDYGPRAHWCEAQEGWLAHTCECLDPGRGSRLRVLVRESLDNARENGAYEGLTTMNSEQESMSLMDYTDIGYDYSVREVRPHVEEWTREHFPAT